MRRLAKTIAILFLPAAAAFGCDNGSGPEPEPEPELQARLTWLQIAPTATTLFTVEPGAREQLVVTGRDQWNAVLDGVEFSFHSLNEAVAIVSSEGMITAVAAGTAEIEVSASFRDVTLQGSSSVTVLVDAPATASVTTSTYRFEPNLVHVRAGGTVTWTSRNLGHEVDFVTPGAPADIPGFSTDPVSRVFPTSGRFVYWCRLHREENLRGMSGVVVVR